VTTPEALAFATVSVAWANAAPAANSARVKAASLSFMFSPVDEAISKTIPENCQPVYLRSCLRITLSSGIGKFQAGLSFVIGLKKKKGVKS
jgi:hypothetical protein